MRDSRLRGNDGLFIQQRHYRSLMQISNQNARSFYEIEASNNNWSYRELERQVNSLLFERLLKSKDKAGLMKLVYKGQEIDVVLKIAQDNPGVDFIVLCGHTHSPGIHQPLPNLLVKTGIAEYYYPEIQEVIAV